MKVKVEISERMSTTWTFSSTLPSGQVIDVAWAIPCDYEAAFAQMMLSKDVKRFLNGRAWRNPPWGVRD